MSRVGKAPVLIPGGVKVTVVGPEVAVEGPRGKLARRMHPDIAVRVDDGKIIVERKAETRLGRSVHGLSRTLIANMVSGVSQGFEKVVEMRGTGYRAEVRAKKLVISAGFSHPVEVDIPDGIQMEVVKLPIVEQMAITQVHIRGADKELVGEVAAGLRRIRPPEPYKGKGIRMLGEYVHRKAGKTAG